MIPYFTSTPTLYLVYYGIGLLAMFAMGTIFGAMKIAEWGRERLKTSRNFQRGVLKGIISEQLAPYLPGFPEDLKPSEAKFLGKPVDFIVFKGMDDKRISEIVFVEVKSGRQYFNPTEDSLRAAIEGKRIRYVRYQVPADIFNQK